MSTSFVKEFAEFYGAEHVLSNFHYLTHMKTAIENHGPLHIETTFLFEAINGMISNFSTSARFVQHQIANRYFLLRTLLHDSDIPFPQR